MCVIDKSLLQFTCWSWLLIANCLCWFLIVVVVAVVCCCWLLIALHCVCRLLIVDSFKKFKWSIPSYARFSKLPPPNILQLPMHLSLFWLYLCFAPPAYHISRDPARPPSTTTNHPLLYKFQDVSSYSGLDGWSENNIIICLALPLNRYSSYRLVLGNYTNI